MKAVLANSSSRSCRDQTLTEATRILNLYRSYQTVGHEKAKVEPLQLIRKYGTKIQIGKRKRLNIERLDYRFHGFTDEQLDQEYYVDSSYRRGFLSMKKHWTLREFIDACEQAYRQSIGLSTCISPILKSWTGLE
jgi:2-oxoglutarate dehydrogenase complex dehydrogenase (E1) component-like enzyme